MKITGCIITKNEEKHIKRCIDSFKKVVNEIIVVDTGSEDDTVNIASGLGAKVYFFQWNNSFADAKNFAIEKATGDWIIFLDADEYFYGGTAKNIPAILKKNNVNKNIDAIRCKLINIDEDNGKLISSVPTIRIFRNGKAMRYVGNIHEMIKNNNEYARYIYAEESLLLVYHTGYSTSKIKGKIKRNLEVLEKNLAEGKADFLTYYYLSECYFDERKYDLAIKYAKLFIEKNDLMVTTGFESRPYLTIINAMYQMKDKYNFDDIRAVINDALKKYSYHPEINMTLAILYFSEKKYEEALQMFLKSVKLNEQYKSIEINSFNNHFSSVYNNIGRIYEYKNDYNSSLEYFVKSLKEDKFLKSSFQGLIKIIKNESSVEVIYLLKSIYDENDYNDVLFLVNELSVIKLGKVLMYFQDILKNKFNNQSDTIFMLTMFATGCYDKAFELFYDYFIRTKDPEGEIFIVISGVLSKKEEMIDKIYEIVSAPYRKLVQSYFNFDNSVKLDANDIDAYLKVLQEVILLNDSEQLERFLKISDNFNIDINELIGEVFFENKLYDRATKYYVFSLQNNPNNANRHVIHFKVGVCFYKLYKYADSVDVFKNAIEKGYNENDIYQYLNWISEQCKDEKIINRVAEIKNYHWQNSSVQNISEDVEEIASNVNIEHQDYSINEMKQYKKLVKENLNQLISMNKLEEAKSIIDEYEKIIIDDTEVYSIKAVIAIMENRLDDAEFILNRGLKLNNNDFDLLYNMGYLKELKGDYNFAIDFYNMSINSADNIELKNQVKEMIERIVAN